MYRFVLFVLVALAFVSPKLAAAYSIAPGDTLRVDVLEDPTLGRSVLVLPDGSINFPGVGSLKVGGRSPAAVENALADTLAREFAARPSVYVSVAGLAPTTNGKSTTKNTQIYVMGEIGKPGAIEAEDGATLLQAIAQAGGFTRFAATKRVQLHRVDPKTGTEQIYIYDYRNNSGISGATRLAKGDVIVVPERGLFE